MAFREAPEGIVYSGQQIQSILGGLGTITIKPTRFLSKTEIEVLDMISEGEIEGLVSGEWNFSGNAGEIGWTTAEFTRYSKLAGSTTENGYLRSIYWNEVPILNSLGQSNYQSVDVSYTKGTPNGGLVNEDNPELTVSRTIGERLRGTELDPDTDQPTSEDVDNSKVYRIFNKDCVAAIVNIKVQSLAKTLTNDEGQVVNTEVVYRIYYRPMFNIINQGPGEEANYQPPVSEEIKGKVNYGYVRSTRIDFDTTFADRREFLGWEIKIVRVTPDALQSNLRNQTYIDSITEVYTSRFLYPNSAIVRQKFSAEFFQRVPNRAFDTQLLKVKIPSNYDPIYRTYDESNNGWDGTFKEQKQWTDNPVWCYYDLITNPRYGLGKYISEDNVDKWSLYEASKYCDTLVPDGYGNVEPRFTCNLILTEREEAYKVINDMASIFRAITYYGGGSIFTVQDSPKEPLLQFTNANVENGNFNYSSSAKKARHTVAVVRYNDPLNFFKPAVEYVEDVEGIRRYGIRETEISAFGCTSRGQALRLGRWALLTETLETETVNFIAGLDATYLRPGDVFKIFDKHKKTQRHGGRARLIENFSDSANIVLDSTISINTGNQYVFSVLTPGYFYDPVGTQGLTSNDYSGIRNTQLQNFTITGIQTTGLSGEYSLVKLYEPFDEEDYSLQRNLIWTLELASGSAESSDFIYEYSDYYRVINIAEKEQNKYEVVGLQYSPQKYIEIESGLSFDRPLSSYNVVPEAPIALDLTVIDKTVNTKLINYSFVIDNYTGVTSYRVYAKTGLFDDENVPIDNWLIDSLPLETQQGNYLPTETGDYYFRVYSANDEIAAFSTGYASGNILIEDVNPIRDIIISSLQLNTGIDIVNDPGYRDIQTFEGESPSFVWQVGVADETSVSSDLTYRITVRSGSATNTPDSNIIYEVTGFNPIGENQAWTFDFETNNGLPNGPFRNYDVVVEAMNSNNETSAGNIIDSVDNQFDNHPFGYDILNVYNPIPTGISLTDEDGNNQFDNGYKTTGYVTPNGQITIIFTGETALPEDIVGGYLYTVKAPNSVNFDSGDAIAGQKGTRTIFRTEFSIDPTLAKPYIFTPSPVPVTAQKTRVAISLFDKFDKAKLNKGKDIYDKLWISDFVRLFQVSEVSDAAIAQRETPEDGSSIKRVKMHIETGANETYKFVTTSTSGDQYIINTFNQ